MSNTSERIAARPIGDGDALPFGEQVHDAAVAPGSRGGMLPGFRCGGVQQRLPDGLQQGVDLERLDKHGGKIVVAVSLQRRDHLAAGPLVLGHAPADGSEELSEWCWHRGVFRRGTLRNTATVNRVRCTTNKHDGRPSLVPEDAIRHCLMRAGGFSG
jgi:hypothetical protein